MSSHGHVIQATFCPLAGLNPAGIWSAAKPQSLLLTLILVVTAFWVSPAAAQKYVTDPTTGKVVTAPEYDGTITFAKKEEPAGPDTVISGVWAQDYVGGVLETLSMVDCDHGHALPRYLVGMVTPNETDSFHGGPAR